MELPQFSESYSIIAPVGAVSLDVDFALEDISGERVDLDTYKLDLDRTPPAQELRWNLLNSLNEPAVVVAYRPFALLSALVYPRSDYVTYLGMFHERQATFEHKTWVENELKKIGVPIVPWSYFADEDVAQLAEFSLASDPIVVRTNRSDGGAGLRVVSRSEGGLGQLQTEDGFFGAAPYLYSHIPLNINGCIFGDGTISLHPPSIQLIGCEGLTRRQFGYCGNDFTAVKNLDSATIDQLNAIIKQTAGWLYSQGYLGAFGLDALVHEGEVLLAEINPRFQGSSSVSARIDKSLERPDIFLCHLAAYLGLSSPTRERLKDLVAMQEGLSQLILHNTREVPVSVAGVASSNQPSKLELIPNASILIHPDATLFRLVVQESVFTYGNPAAITDKYLTAVLEETGVGV